MMIAFQCPLLSGPYGSKQVSHIKSNDYCMFLSCFFGIVPKNYVKKQFEYLIFGYSDVFCRSMTLQLIISKVQPAIPSLSFPRVLCLCYAPP